MGQQQTQTADNDLQKAIDDITNITNTDPVFSDPVAAPSSIPEGDTGELGEPIGPFPEPKVEMVPPAPEPIAPLESVVNIPELNAPPLEQTPPAPTPDPLPPAPAPEPLPEMPLPDSTSTDTSDFKQLKIAALRDLVPLMDHLDMSPLEKYNIFCDVFENTKDFATLELAYKAARDIEDKPERAKALYSLIELIDNSKI